MTGDFLDKMIRIIGYLMMIINGIGLYATLYNFNGWWSVPFVLLYGLGIYVGYAITKIKED
jgi:hypothetical protein